MQIKYSNIGATEPILASDVKAWLKVDFNDEDALINSLITQVREIAEEASGLALIDKTIEYFEDDADILSDWIKLPYPQHNAITEVKVNGELSTSYAKTGLTQFLIRVDNFASTTSSDNGLYVKYTTLANCPEGVRLAMLEVIAENYEKRGNTFEGGLAKMTDNFYNHLQKFKVY